MDKEILHIYTRVSTDSQEDNTSLKQQRDRGERLAKSLGFKPQVWNEGSASSSKDDFENRPILTELMGLITSGQVKHLYAEYQDRLSRNTKTWGAIRYALRDNDVLFYSQSDPNPVDLTDPTDELIFGVLSEISQFDNRMREMRLSSGKFKRVAEGKWQGGPPPFGYKLVDKLLVPHESESEWVRKMYEWCASGKTTRQIQDLLRDNGVTTRRGNSEWALGSIEKVLRNEHYTGHYVVTRHKTGESWRNECPVIITKDLRDRVEKVLGGRSYQSRLKQPNQKHFYLLTDFLYCGACGRKMRGRINPKQKQQLYYCGAKEEEWRRGEKVVTKCDGIRSVKIDLTDQAVWDAVVGVISNSYIFKESVKNAELKTGSYALSEKEVLSNKRKLREIEKKIEKYTTSIGNLKANILVGDNKGEYLATVKKLELDRERLSSEKESISVMISDSEKGKRWVDWVSAFKGKLDQLQKLTDKQEQHTFLKQITDRIEIHGIKDDFESANLNIKLTLPYVDDQLVWRNTKKKSEGYEITPGKDSFDVVYPLVYPTKKKG